MPRTRQHSNQEAPPEAPQRERKTRIVWASETTNKPVTWLEYLRLPAECLSLIAGKPDTGKSQVAIDKVARLTRGELPGKYLGTPVRCLYLATEDDWRMTIRPRLEAAGANMTMVAYIESVKHPGRGYALSFTHDAEELREHIVANGFRVVVFDPLVSIATGTNWNKAEEVRPLLEALKAMLEETGCSAIGLMHFRKQFGIDALEQIAGSGAWGQVVRAALALIRDPDREDEKQIIASLVKHNLGPEMPSKTFTFRPVTVPSPEGECKVSRVEWGADSAWSVEDIMNGANSEKATKAKESAGEWLLQLLADGKPMLVDDIKKAYTAANGTGPSSWRTVERAKATLPIKTTGGNRHMLATWQLRTPASSGTGKPGATGVTGEPRSRSASTANNDNNSC